MYYQTDVLFDAIICVAYLAYVTWSLYRWDEERKAHERREAYRRRRAEREAARRR